MLGIVPNPRMRVIDSEAVILFGGSRPECGKSVNGPVGRNGTDPCATIAKSGNCGLYVPTATCP